MGDKSVGLLDGEAEVGKPFSLERHILGIVTQLTMDPHHYGVLINKGLKDIGETLGLERAFIRIIDDHFIIKDQLFLWNRIKADCRPIPQYTISTERRSI